MYLFCLCVTNQQCSVTKTRAHQEWQLPSCTFNPVPYTTDKCEPSLEDYLVCREALTDVKFSFCVTELAPIHFIERCEQVCGLARGHA